MQLIAKTSEAKPMLVAETAPAVSQGGERAVRICLPTWRKFTRKAFQCGWYEAQDVLAETTGADLIPVEANLGFRDREALQRRLLYHDISRRLVHVNPGLRKIRLTENYDVFIAVCQTHSDFLYINALENWQDRCGTSILWIDELWAKRIPLYKYWLHAIKRFDHIFIAAYGSVEALSERLGKQCHWLPSAVDAARFCPYPVTPERVIDVYSIGRRLPAVHKVILRLAEERGLFYVHDTASGADMDAFDQKEHGSNSPTAESAAAILWWERASWTITTKPAARLNLASATTRVLPREPCFSGKCPKPRHSKKCLIGGTRLSN